MRGMGWGGFQGTPAQNQETGGGSMRVIRFRVEGDVVAQGRPRLTTVGGHARAYDPAASRDYKHYVRLVASQHKGEGLMEGPVAVKLVVGRKIPSSWSKRKQDAAQKGEILPTTKPDVDNMAKGVKDALSGVIWRDDAQVVELTVRKVYAPAGYVEVEVAEVQAQGSAAKAA